MQFDKLIESILEENIGMSGAFAGDSGSDAIKAHERGRAEDLADMNRRSGGSDYTNQSIRSRERNIGTEKDAKLEKVYWNVFQIIRDENGKVKERNAVVSVDKETKKRKQFGAYGYTKALALIRKLMEKPFNAGKEFDLLTDRGETKNEYLYGT